MKYKIFRLIGSSLLALVITLSGITRASATSSNGAAQNPVQLLPTADGFILDQSPFDGVGDAVEDGSSTFTYLNSGIAEFHGAMEFDLSTIPPNNTIESAILYVTPIGRSYPSHTSTLPVQLFGYSGNGTIDTGDFNIGSAITVFDGLAAPLGVPVTLDVTEFLQNQMPGKYVGFTLRLDVNGSVNFTSLEVGVPPKLVITLKPMKVNIDIKPGSDTNPINTKSQGTTPVAILSTADFDATTMLDQPSLSFGATGDETSLAFCDDEAQDVNSDGLLDLVCHFHTQQTGFQIGDLEGILKGQTMDGTALEGNDLITFITTGHVKFNVCPFDPISITLSSPDPVWVPVQITTSGQDINFGADDPPGVYWALTDLDGNILVGDGPDDHFHLMWGGPYNFSEPGYYYMIFSHPLAGTTYPNIQINLACDFEAPEP